MSDRQELSVPAKVMDEFPPEFREKFTQEQPARFAQFALRLPENSHPYYLSHILRGLKDEAIPSESKLLVARRVFGVNHRGWCQAALVRLFSDQSEEVRKKAAGCFWHLWQSPDTPLTGFDALIRSFLKSAAFAEDPTFLLHALEENKHRVPEATLD